MFSNLGQFYSFARGVLRGGIGEFRQSIDPTLLADASVRVGFISPDGRPRRQPADWRAAFETLRPKDAA